MSAWTMGKMEWFQQLLDKAPKHREVSGRLLVDNVPVLVDAGVVRNGLLTERAEKCGLLVRIKW